MPKAHFRYEVIAEDLRQNIHSGQHPVGHRLPPEPDLARQYGVNRITLRKALHLLEADGLLDRRPGRGTFVLTPRDGKPAAPDNRMVLFVGPRHGHLREELFQAVVGAAQASGRGVYPFDPKDPSGCSAEAVRTVQGLLDAGGSLLATDGAWREATTVAGADRRAPVHIELLGPAWPLLPGYHAAADHLRAGLIATRHLLQLGHRRIAFIGAHPEDSPAPDPLAPVKLTHPACEGYRLALAESGVAEERSLGYYAAGVDRRGVELLGKFLDRLDGWASAFVCDADFRAVTLNHALQERGLKVPGDISLVGMGNTPWCEMVGTGLDSIDLAVPELARLALSLCALPPPAGPVVCQLTPTLVVRGSTAPLAPPAATPRPKAMRRRP